MTDYHINIFFSEEDGGYVADIPDLESCSAFGETPEKALYELERAKAAWLEAARKEGKPVPPPRYRPAINQHHVNMKKISLFTLTGAITAMLMLSACQGQSKDYHIPEDSLKNMSTKELAETVINSPILMDMLAFNTVQDGFEKVSSEYNGLSELLNREDAGSELSAIYHKMEPAVVKGFRTDSEKGSYVFKIQYIETILAQERILERLSPVQLHDLLKECIAKYEGKQQLADLYGKADSTVRLMGRIMQHTSYAAFTRMIPDDIELQTFLSKGSFSSEAVRNEILSQAQQYLTES